MKWQDVYRAAAMSVARVEQMHGKGKQYEKAVAGLATISDMACDKCAGFSWYNDDFGHVVSIKHPDSKKCEACYGSGFKVEP